MLSSRLKKLTHNSTLRLVFSYFVIFIVSSLILLSFVYWTTIDYIYQQLDHHIEYDRNNLEQIYRNEGSDKLVQAIKERLAQKNYDSLYLLYQKQGGQVLIGNMSLDEDFLKEGLQMVTLDIMLNESDHRRHTARVMKTTLDNSLVLINGLDTESVHEQEHKIANSLFAGVAIIIFLGAIGGFIISINTIKKVNLINDTMKKIGEGEIDQRVPLRGTDDDFDLLAENFNDMLDRLQLLMDQVHNISINVAHDLRTPLTRIRNRLETIEERCSKADMNEIELAIEDTDNLLATFETILNINKFETGVQKLNIQLISIKKLIGDIIDYYEPLAMEKTLEIDFSLQEDILFYADQNMMFLALSNLLNNAIKYSPQQETISISACVQQDSEQNRQLNIWIADHGLGISDEDKKKVFDLFYRSEKHRDQQGNGLGLSLVAAIIHLHKGEIKLSDNQPQGLRVDIYLDIDKFRPVTQ